MATPGMTVAGTERRKRKITITTSPMARIRVNRTSATDSRTAADWSRRMSSKTDSGSCFWKAGRSARTRSTTSTVLVPGCFWIARTMARAPRPLV